MKKFKMKKKHLVIISVVPVLVAAGIYLLSRYAQDLETTSQDVAVDADEEQLYTCPMHPEVVQEGPGTCPICKMDLVPMKKERAGAQDAAAMEHDHDHGAHPAGATQAAAQAQADQSEQLYTCPMHPEVVQEGPGTCPICKMDLVPMKKDRAGGAAVETGDERSRTTTGPSVTIDPVVVQNMGVRVAEVERTPLFRHVRTVGEIDVAEDEVSVVNLRFSGWIERLYVDETGQRVKRGQPLFAVYSPELVQAQEEYLMAVNAQGEDSRLARSAARRLELWGISKRYLNKIARGGEVSRNITIYAPRTGYVLHKNIVLGARVQAGNDLYRIGDLRDSVWVEAEVYEYDAPWIKEGQPATMELSFQQGRTWEGQVDYVYPTLNPETRTLRVRLSFANPGLSLKPGMLATVRIEVGRKDGVITVPHEAVLHSGERRIAFVALGGGKYQPRELELGLVGDNRRVEVLSGLDEGDDVVVSGQFLLDSESQLQEAVQKLIDARLQAKQKPREAEAKEGGAPADKGDEATYWTCPMHPEVVQEEPGTCPICGMDLVEKKR